MPDILEYYRSIYGEPVRKATFKSPEGAAIDVFKWDESQTDEGVTMYATSGANKILGSLAKSCEFFIGISPEADSIAIALAEVALHGNGTMGVPASGDTIALTYGLWKGTQAKAFMFTNGDELIPPLGAQSGKEVNFVQLVPLFDKELAYKISHGEAALWEKFESNGVRYWDSSRNSSIV